MQDQLPVAGLFRRFMSFIYECLLWAALMLVAGFVFIGITHDSGSVAMRPYLRAWVLLVSACYFVWFWTKTGQTVAMKVWRIRLIACDGQPLSPRRALARFIWCLVSLTLLGAGWLWCLVDRDRQFLHDRMAGTRMVPASSVAPAPTTASPTKNK